MMDMTLGAQIALATVIVALLVYPLITSGLARAVQPLRLRMADLGCELLASPHISERDKNVIDGMLADAYRWRTLAEFVVFLPVYMVQMRRRRVPKIVIEDAETRKKFREFMSLHLTSAIAANPVFAFLLVIELFFVIVFLLCLGSLLKISDVLIGASVYAEAPGRNVEAC